ncbi:DUF221-domain-containing protein [Dendrothele bispora CBS 962.96]|uniref:DUF221-domain-containing protein n=1 Tax=Dendrothele bispora (strain CBS 962.96) TaxID=1314807 RepID=A0A4S8LVP1_DENBC|nr:DUF221-domain-containing protein [Dendrothele bispora CBS 962.96]
MSDSDRQEAQSASTPTFVTALVFNAIVFGAEIGVFTLLRPYFKAIYEPRTYVPPKSRRIAPLTPSFKGVLDLKTYLSWPYAVFISDPEEIKHANGLDAYFFVRFLRMMVKIFLPIWLVSWAVLLPITSVGTSVDGHTGLDRFIFGNVSNDQSERYAATSSSSISSLVRWVFYNIYREMGHFVTTRQLHLINPNFSKTVQANTVLITGIPARYLTHAALRTVFGSLPGGVKTIWINRNLGDLPDIYDRRLAACGKLESAETKLLGIAAKLKQAESKGKGKKSSEKDPEAAGSAAPANSGTIPEIPRESRPTHKLGFLGLFGEKVDTIDWCREEIKTCTDLLEEGRKQIPGYNPKNIKRHSFHFDDPDSDADDDFGGQEGVIGAVGKVGRVGAKVGGKVGSGVQKVGTVVRHRNRKDGGAGEEGADVEHVHKEEETEGAENVRAEPETGNSPVNEQATASNPYPPLNAAFITFRKQISAHLAGQALVHHDPYRMSGKHIGVSPSDVIWGNLGLNEYEMKVRWVISWGATAALIIFWAIPVSFVGIVSNIHTVCTTASWLNWLCNLPPVVIGIISGILPPVLLAVLMMLLPIVLRLLASFEGIPKRSGVELSLMDRFFLFQVVHSFIVLTLSSGIVASLQDLLNSPASIPSTLARNLPQASTFFLTYVILQGLSGAAGGFLQIVPLVIYYVKLYLLGSTPRSVWGIKYGARSVAWGTLFPGITLLTVICEYLKYSNWVLWSCMADPFSLLQIALSYSIISPIINGLACATFFLFYLLYKYLFLWAKTFTGLYLQMICLAALFFLARDENSNASAVPEGALMIVLIVVTIFFNVIIKNSYGPLIHALPLTLAEKMYSAADVDDESVPHSPNGRSNDVEMHDRASGGGGNVRPSVDGSEVEHENLKSSAIHNSPAIAEEGGKANLHDNDNDDQEPDPDAPKPIDRPKPRAEEEYGFAHPAASRPQRTIWIPKDQLGLGEEEERANLEMGIDASVDLSGEGQPPDLVLE